jgi:(2Fe-2S) ferredoxin
MKCNGKQDGICNSRGSKDIIDKLDKLIIDKELSKEVLVTSCGCFRSRISKLGPNMVIYPEGTWYGGISAEDLEEIVESHFKEHKIVDRFLLK